MRGVFFARLSNYDNDKTIPVASALHDRMKFFVSSIFSHCFYRFSFVFETLLLPLTTSNKQQT
jgi:hypothetical protein